LGPGWPSALIDINQLSHTPAGLSCDRILTLRVEFPIKTPPCKKNLQFSLPQISYRPDAEAQTGFSGFFGSLGGARFALNSGMRQKLFRTDDGFPSGNSSPRNWLPTPAAANSSITSQ
jgi:hypothetical protein